jgi:hypothetical protein
MAVLNFVQVFILSLVAVSIVDSGLHLRVENRIQPQLNTKGLSNMQPLEN